MVASDIYEEVDGKGIERLRNAGVEVITGVLENESKELNKRFFTFHQQKPALYYFKMGAKCKRENRI